MRYDRLHCIFVPNCLYYWLCSMQSLLSLHSMILFYHQRSMLMWSFLVEVIIMLPLIWLCNISAQSLVSMIYAKYIQTCMLFSLHFRYLCYHSLSILLFSVYNNFKFIEDPVARPFCSPKETGLPLWIIL